MAANLRKISVASWVNDSQIHPPSQFLSPLIGESAVKQDDWRMSLRGARRVGSFTTTKLWSSQVKSLEADRRAGSKGNQRATTNAIQ
jgi:hypothetical protein